MWFLIQLFIFLCSLGSFAFVVYTDSKSGGFVRAVARTTLGTSGAVVKLIGYLVLCAIFSRLGWYPLAAAVLVSLSSLIWAWTGPTKSPEDFE